MRTVVRLALVLLTIGVVWIRVQAFRTAAAEPMFTDARVFGCAAASARVAP